MGELKKMGNSKPKLNDLGKKITRVPIQPCVIDFTKVKSFEDLGKIFTALDIVLNVDIDHPAMKELLDLGLLKVI